MQNLSKPTQAAPENNQDSPTPKTLQENHLTVKKMDKKNPFFKKFKNHRLVESKKKLRRVCEKRFWKFKNECFLLYWFKDKTYITWAYKRGEKKSVTSAIAQKVDGDGTFNAFEFLGFLVIGEKGEQKLVLGMSPVPVIYKPFLG